jgi:hypothetical protein
MIIGFTNYDSSRQAPKYGVQLAFGFGSNKIAIRYANYIVYEWSDWRII